MFIVNKVNPCKMLSFRQISDVVLIRVCLSLERQVHVGLIPIPILNQPEKKLYAIPNEEWEHQHFLLLDAMYFFVID